VQDEPSFQVSTGLAHKVTARSGQALYDTPIGCRSQNKLFLWFITLLKTSSGCKKLHHISSHTTLLKCKSGTGMPFANFSLEWHHNGNGLVDKQWSLKKSLNDSIYSRLMPDRITKTFIELKSKYFLLNIPSEIGISACLQPLP